MWILVGFNLKGDCKGCAEEWCQQELYGTFDDEKEAENTLEGYVSAHNAKVIKEHSLACERICRLSEKKYMCQCDSRRCKLVHPDDSRIEEYCEDSPPYLDLILNNPENPTVLDYLPNTFYGWTGGDDYIGIGVWEIFMEKLPVIGQVEDSSTSTTPSPESTSSFESSESSSPTPPPAQKTRKSRDRKRRRKA